MSSAAAGINAWKASRVGTVSKRIVFAPDDQRGTAQVLEYRRQLGRELLVGLGKLLLEAAGHTFGWRWLNETPSVLDRQVAGASALHVGFGQRAVDARRQTLKRLDVLPGMIKNAAPDGRMATTFISTWR